MPIFAASTAMRPGVTSSPRLVLALVLSRSLCTQRRIKRLDDLYGSGKKLTSGFFEIIKIKINQNKLIAIIKSFLMKVVFK